MVSKKVMYQRRKIFPKAEEGQIRGLVKNGTFHVLNISSKGKDIRIFGSILVDSLKAVYDCYRYKSTLATQNYGDKPVATIATKASTVQRFTQRLFLSLAASMDDASPYLRDINQVYIRFAAPPEQELYIQTPKEMILPPYIILKIVKPLYGVLLSGLHCHLTCLEHNISAPNMIWSRVELCFFFKDTTSHYQQR